MYRTTVLTTLYLCLAFTLQAQTPLPPAAHGGDLNRTLDLRDPQGGTLLKVLEYDYEKLNPRYRTLLPDTRSCTTVEMEVDRQVQHAAETESAVVFESWINGAIQRAPKTRGGLFRLRRVEEELYTLPVVVHVIYSNPTENISDEQVLSQIDVLNQDYRRLNPDRERTPRDFRNVAVDMGIEFCMAGIDPNGNPTNGIHRVSMNGSPFGERYVNEVIKPTTIWDPNRYLNIWVCNLSGGILGFAQFPQSSGLVGIPQQGSAATDGVVINYTVFGTLGTVVPPFDRGRTTTHELGHWMGLRHIWGDGPCGTDDFCADTPESDGANFACPPGRISCQGGAAMISNFMDYTDDACMNLFTEDQKDRARAVLRNSPRRSALLNSNVCSAGVKPPEPTFTANVRSGCGPLTVQFRDESVGQPEKWKWRLPGARPDDPEDPNPIVVYRKPGTYPVTLEVSNAGGTRSHTEQGYIVVMADGVSLPVLAEFEPGMPFPPAGFTRFNPQQDQAWALSERIGGQGLSRGSMSINNYDNNLTGSADWFLTPIMDFSQSQGTMLSFDVAYASFDPRYTDTLGVFVATDCGAIFRSIYYKGGERLQTVGELNKPFVPLEDEWRTEAIDLSQFDGNKAVQIAFVNFSGYGNDLYLDNVRIGRQKTPPPSPDFTASSRQVCAGTEIRFADASSQRPNSWVWAFPGGFPASDTTPSPTVRYTQAGTYDVILTVANEGGTQTITRKQWVVVQPEADLSLSASDSVICKGEEITLSASGAASLNWDLGETDVVPLGNSVTLQPPHDATYSVSGISDNGCRAEASVIVRVKEGQTLQVSPPSARICKGQSIQLNATGALRYRWSPSTGLDNVNSGLVTVSPRESTTYRVIGTTAEGCELKQEVRIEVDNATAELSVSASPTNICPGESVVLRASGAAGYRWTPNQFINIAEGPEIIASPARTTTYQVAATTENGCAARGSVTIRVDPKPLVQVRASKTVLCEGAQTTLQARGANQYTWSPSSLTGVTAMSNIQVSPRQDTEIQVVGFNQAGCRDTAQLLLRVISPQPITVQANPPVVCRGQSSILTASGAFSYRWYPGEVLSENRGARIVARPDRDRVYRVVGTDENGCQSEAEVNVKVATGSIPVARFSADQTVACAGQEVQFRAQSRGGEAGEYFWEFPGGTPSSSQDANPKVSYAIEGIYDVRLTVRGCGGAEDRSIEPGYIVVTAPIGIRLNTSDISICAGEQFSLSASGAQQYAWSPALGLDRTQGSTVVASPNQSTTYTVVGTDAEGCRSQARVRLSVIPRAATLQLNPAAPVICRGASVSLQASGAATYTWSPAQGLNQTQGATVVAKPERTTTYRVEATDINGCFSEGKVTVTVNDRPQLKVSPANPVICKGDQITLSVAEEGIYRWSPTQQLSTTTGRQVTAFPQTTTTYTVVGQNAFGCEASAEVTVRVEQGQAISLKAQDLRICRGEFTLLTAEGGFDYSWAPTLGLDQGSGPLVKASPQETTTYTVRSGKGGCQSSRSVTIEVIQPIPLSIAPADPRICAGESQALSVSGGANYIWDQAPGLNSIAGAQVRVKPDKTTSYTVRAIDRQGCETSASVSVIVNQKDFLQARVSAASVCPDAKVDLVAEGATSYEWLPAEGLEDLNAARVEVRPRQSSVFRVVGRDENNCLDTATLRVDVRQASARFVASKSRLDLASDPGLVVFNDQTLNAREWEWDFGIGSTSTEANPSHVYTAPGVYTVKLKVNNGVCTQEVNQEIVVENTSSLEELIDEGELRIMDQAASTGRIELSANPTRSMYLQLRLLDLAGIEKVVSALRLKPGEFRKVFNLEPFDKGIYHLQITDGEETVTKRVVYQ